MQSIKDIGIDIEHPNLSLYKLSLDNINKSFERSIFEADINANEIEKIQKDVSSDLKLLIERLKKENNLLQPSEEEVLINDITEKIRLLGDKITRKNEVSEKQRFYNAEVGRVTDIFNEFFRLVEKDIITRFKDISSTIEQYFKILRQDKDIKDIEITLNLDTARAIGRSAEIQLSYYNLVVKPAYKVLSESLLNSLGLAVYFTCVKKFNLNSKFIVLDDVMNSLDVGHRDTLLDLIQQEFSDFQVILFTHDMHWFEKIQRRFPGCNIKKSKAVTALLDRNLIMQRLQLMILKICCKIQQKLMRPEEILGFMLKTY